MWLAGLRFNLFRTIFIYIFYLAWVSLALILFFVLLASTSTYRNSMVSKNLKLIFGVCDEKVKFIKQIDGIPANWRFCWETTRNKKSGV